MNTLVSVIIPVYNVEKYLPQCLDSLIGQTYKNIEIIAVNDGSTDNSGDILGNYAKNDSRIIIVSQQNQGPSVARNQGIEHSTGEYLMFVDGDDWLDIKTVETALSSIQTTKSDVVLFSYIREYENKSFPRHLFNADRTWQQDDFCNLYRRIFGLMEGEMSNPASTDTLGTVWAKLYKTSVIKENRVRFIDLKIIGSAEDVLFNVHLFAYMKQATYLDHSFYHYRKFNTNSLTNLYRPFLYCQWQNLFMYMQAVIDDFRLGVIFQTALNNRIALSIIGLGLNEYVSNASPMEKVKRLSAILLADRYRNAYKNLSFSFFPLHWKFFFLCAKHQFVWGVYFLLLCIGKIIKLRN